MDDERSVVDQALDLLVYAPLGLALEAKDLIPKLAERGRGQVALARLAGRFAARRGQEEGRRFVQGLSGEGDASAPSGGNGGSTGPAPFPGYDDLDAKAILGRLDTMSANDLQRLLAYEQGHRARSTIISRIQQLQG